MSESALLASLGIDGFEQPARILLAAAVAVVLAVLTLRRRQPALGLPTWVEARRAGARRFDPVTAGGWLLRLAALALLALVIGRPVGVHTAPPEPGFGLDLVLVVDASGSMRALDAELGGEWRTRLDLARRVVARFAARRAAEGDRVALVVFGERAFTQCPLTSDGALLQAALARLEAGVAGEATALGDALALAVKRAGGGAQAPGAQGRVAVLLTDGRNNAGAVSVEVATALAAADGLRVHTVAIGTAGEEVLMQGTGGAQAPPRRERHDIDAESLARVATATGGRFFHARRSSDLDAVYSEIDSLERVERPLPPRLRRTDRPQGLLALAGGCVVGELALVRVTRRRMP